MQRPDRHAGVGIEAVPDVLGVLGVAVGDDDEALGGSEAGKTLADQGCSHWRAPLGRRSGNHGTCRRGRAAPAGPRRRRRHRCLVRTKPSRLSSRARSSASLATARKAARSTAWSSAATRSVAKAARKATGPVAPITRRAPARSCHSPPAVAGVARQHGGSALSAPSSSSARRLAARWHTLWRAGAGRPLPRSSAKAAACFSSASRGRTTPGSRAGR